MCKCQVKLSFDERRVSNLCRVEALEGECDACGIELLDTLLDRIGRSADLDKTWHRLIYEDIDDFGHTLGFYL